MDAVDPVEQTLGFNKNEYADYYNGPLVDLRYDLFYRQRRLANLLAEAGIDPAVPGFAAFEYGFGAGHLLRVVEGASHVLGLEFSQSAVAKARAAKPTGHPDWQIRRHDDAARLDVRSNTFDLVTASHVLEHLEHDYAALDEFIRVLKPGGHLLIVLPANEQLFPGTKHLRVYDVAEFAARLRRMGLERVAIDEHQRFDRPWKHHKMILRTRKGLRWRALVEGTKAALFLPLLAISWRTLAFVDSSLAVLGAKSTSVAYLFRKPCETLGTDGVQEALP